MVNYNPQKELLLFEDLEVNMAETAGINKKIKSCIEFVQFKLYSTNFRVVF